MEESFSHFFFFEIFYYVFLLFISDYVLSFGGHCTSINGCVYITSFNTDILKYKSFDFTHFFSYLPKEMWREFNIQRHFFCLHPSITVWRHKIGSFEWVFMTVCVIDSLLFSLSLSFSNNLSFLHQLKHFFINRHLFGRVCVCMSRTCARSLLPYLLLNNKIEIF